MPIRVRNDLAELERVGRMLGEFWAEHDLPEELAGEINLVLEEMLANVILHGYQDQGDHEIVVKLESQGGELTLAIEDDGVVFNPLEKPRPDLTVPLAERQVGGLGIFLVRELMDHLQYERLEDRNRLTMKKRVTAA